VALAKGVITKQEKARGRDYTPKQRKFLTLLIKNDFKDPKKCLLEAGYSNDSWNAIYALKDDIKELAEAILISNTPNAAAIFGEVLTSDTPIPQATAKIAAAKEILDRVGLTKEDRVKLQHEHSGGIFLIPSKAPLELEDAIPGEFTEVHSD